jgi:hypothetical protein
MRFLSRPLRVLVRELRGWHADIRLLPAPAPLISISIRRLFLKMANVFENATLCSP